MTLIFEKTERGFRRAVFVDFYGNTNSIQESSIATDSCIWLGCERTMSDEPSTRMHLTRSMAAALLRAIAHFVMRGSLPDQRIETAETPAIGIPYSDAYAVLIDEFGRWHGDDEPEPDDAFDAEMRNAIRMGAIGALSNAVARLTCGNSPIRDIGCLPGGAAPDVCGRIGPATEEDSPPQRVS